MRYCTLQYIDPTISKMNSEMKIVVYIVRSPSINNTFDLAILFLISYFLP